MDKRKKMILIISLLALTSILLLTLVTDSKSDPTESPKEVSLRATAEDVSLEDMMNRQNTPVDQPQEVNGYPESNISTIEGSDDPAQVEQVQNLIRANEQNIEMSKQSISNDREKNYTPQYAEDNIPKPKPKKKEKKVSLISTPEPPKSAHSVFNTVSIGDNISARNAIKAYVHSDQIVSEGSTLKMRLAEDCVTDNNVTIPKNSPIFGEVKGVSGERVMVEIKYINYNGSILPFKKKVYSRDAIMGIYVPGTNKAEINKQLTEGAADGLPTDIPIDPSLQLASAVASSAISAGKQAITKIARKTKVLIKTNYELYLRSSEN